MRKPTSSDTESKSIRSTMQKINPFNQTAGAGNGVGAGVGVGVLARTTREADTIEAMRRKTRAMI